MNHPKSDEGVALNILVHLEFNQVFILLLPES